jgi:hypothetical protein
MSTVRLDSDYGSVEDLPDLCMKCGAPADLRKNKSFSWYPPWVSALLLAGLIPFAIVALILTKRCRVEVPLCAQHKGHWLMRQLLVIGTLLALLGGGVIAMFASMDNHGNDNLSGMVCLGWVGLMIGWIVLAAIVQLTSIRPKEITDSSITLTGVSDAFAEAYEEEWSERPEELDEVARDRWNKKDRRRAADSDRVRRAEEDEDEDEDRRSPPGRYRR